MIDKKPILFLAPTTGIEGYNTGVQKVTRNLANALIAHGENIIPVTFENEQLVVSSDKEMDGIGQFGGPDRNAWGLGKNKKEMQEQIYTANFLICPELPKRGHEKYQNYEVIAHCRQNNIKTAYVFHDAIPVVFRYLGFDWAWFSQYMKEINFADYIFAVSESSKNDYIKIMSEYSFGRQAKLITIPLATELPGQQSSPPKELDPKNINIAYVASFDTRKNHEYLYNAFNIVLDNLKNTDIKLTLSIAGTEYFKDQAQATRWWAERLPMEAHFSCTDETIYNIYKNADLTVFPSLYEGFGLPIVESLFMNTPVLTSSGGSLKEVASGGGCVIFDLPEDIHNFNVLAEKIYDLVINSDKILQLQKEIPNRPKRTWSEYSLDILKELI